MTDHPAGPNAPSLDLSALITECRDRLAAGNAPEAATIARTLEAARPGTEPAWQALHALFTDLGSAVWAEIMTDRFLAAQPRNQAARLVKATSLSTLRDKQAEAVRELDTLVEQGIDGAAALVQAALLYARVQRGERAMALFEMALAAEPASVQVRTMLVHHCIHQPDLARARSEILTIRARAGGSARTLATAATLAMRIGDHPLAADILAAAVAMAAPDRVAAIGTLIGIAARLRHPCLPDLLADSDFTAISDAGQIAAIHAAIEGLGFGEAERRLVAHGVSLDPNHAALALAARRLAAPLTGRFAAATAGARPSRRRMVRAAMDRMRALMVWR